MKIVTAKNGSQKAVLSKSNWESIGMKEIGRAHV